MTCGPGREVVGVFGDEPSLGAAVDDLLMSGFERSDISVLVGRRRTRRKHSSVANYAPKQAKEPEAPSTAYIGDDARTQAKIAIVAGLGYLGAMSAVFTAISSGGTVLVAVVGAATAGIIGGLIGGTISLFLERHHTEYVRRQLAYGGLRLWVHTTDSDHETRACHILKLQAAHDVHVQGVGHRCQNFSTAWHGA